MTNKEMKAPSIIYVRAKGKLATKMTSNDWDMIKACYRLHHVATMRGYTPRNAQYMTTYKGRFGDGFMIFNNYTTQFSTVRYYVFDETQFPM